MLGFFLLLILSLSGIGIRSSALICVVVILQTLTGSAFRRAVGSAPHQSWGDTAVSFAVGVLVSSASHTFLVSTPVEPVGWLLPLVVASPIALFRWGRIARDRQPFGEWMYAFAVIVASTLCVLGRAYKWQFPFGIALICVLILYELRTRRPLGRTLRLGLSVTCCVIAGMAALVGIRHIGSRAELWWTMNSDITFTEAVAQSLSRWGFADHVAAAGQSSLGTYHWLPFAWTGLVDRISGADAWWVSTRVAHILFVFAAAALLWSIFRDLLGQARWVSALSTVTAALIGLHAGANYSGMVGAFWMMAFVWYVTRIDYLTLSMHEIVAITLLSTGLILTKPQFAVPVISATIIVNGLIILRDQRQRRGAFRVVAAIVGSGMFVALLQRILAGSNLATSGVIKLDLVSLGSFGELGNARNVFAFPLAVLSLITVLGVMISVLILYRVTSSSLPRVVQLSAITSALAVIALVVTDSQFNFLGGYLFGVMHMMNAVVVGAALPRLLDFLKSHRWLQSIMVSSMLLSLLLVRRWSSLFDPEPTGSVRDMTLRTLAGAKWIPALFVAVAATLWLRKQSGPTTQRGVFRAGAIISVFLLVNPLSAMVRASSLVFDNETVDRMTSSGVIALDNEVVELTDFVEENIPPSEVLASNVFCAYEWQAACSDRDWWIASARSLETIHVAERCYNYLAYSTDWSLPAVLERRFLIQGPHMFTGCDSVPHWLTERVLNSERFGRSPSSESFRFLCSHGVTWFIADKEFARDLSWRPFGSVRLESGRLLLIELNTETCQIGS